ncbi:MAG: hypothetical protein KKG47_08555 [Proteobacteria bacterium]|nr:hypothetical protein [Pseudomonadota bacterium]MBU1736785.1 hypothetical protein [Pseudomonadota bacterium]
MIYSAKGVCGKCGHDFVLLIAKGSTCRIFRCDTCGQEHEIFSDMIMQIIDGSVKCNCGGVLRKDAPARCPTCYSANVTEGEAMIMHG